MREEGENTHEIEEDDLFKSLLSPLWSHYDKRLRKNVRFPRNYKEANALGCQY